MKYDDLTALAAGYRYRYRKGTLSQDYIDALDKLSNWSWVIQRPVWRPRGAARSYVRALGINTVAQYEKWARSDDCPDDIPLNPRRVYGKKLWKGWADWLGNGKVNGNGRQYIPYTALKKRVRAGQVKSRRQYSNWIKQLVGNHSNIPGDPQRVYVDKWRGWKHFLGT